MCGQESLAISTKQYNHLSPELSALSYQLLKTINYQRLNCGQRSTDLGPPYLWYFSLRGFLYPLSHYFLFFVLWHGVQQLWWQAIVQRENLTMLNTCVSSVMRVLTYCVSSPSTLLQILLNAVFKSGYHIFWWIDILEVIDASGLLKGNFA